ncbi:MAG: hypothetical protein ACI3ZD_16860, partial [Prevotella sp.]
MMRPKSDEIRGQKLERKQLQTRERREGNRKRKTSIFSIPTCQYALTPPSFDFFIAILVQVC